MSVYNVSATKNLNAAKRRRQEELIETYEGLGGGNPAYKPIQNNVLARRQNLPSIPALEKAVVEQYESAPRATGKGLRTGNESNLATHNRLSDIPTIANTNHRNAQQQYANVYNDILNRQIGQTLEELGQTDIARGNNSAYVEDLKRTGGSLNPFDYDNLGDYLMNSPYSVQAALSNYASDVLSGAKDRTEGKAWYQTSPIDYALSQLADRTGVEGTRGNLTPEMIAAGLTEKDLELWNNAQNESERRSLLSEWADKHGFGATVNAVPENFFGSVGNVGRGLKNWVTGKPIEDKPNNGEIYRETVSNNIDVSDKPLPEWAQRGRFNPLNGGTYNDLARLGYSGLNSLADMAFATLLGAPLGAAGGALAKLAPKVGAGIMGVEKASQTMNDAVSRGLNPDQIIAEGVLSGASTAITERMPFDNIWHGSSIIRNVLSEGTQEMAEDLADTFFDEIVTRLGRNNDKSSLHQTYNQFIEAGYSPDEAYQATLNNYGQQLVADGVIGGLTGGLTQGGSNVMQGRNFFTGNLPALNAETQTETNETIPEVKENVDNVKESVDNINEIVDTIKEVQNEIPTVDNFANAEENFENAKPEQNIPEAAQPEVVEPETQAVEQTIEEQPEATPKRLVSRRELNEAVRRAENMKEKLSMFNIKHADSVAQRIDNVLNPVLNTNGNTQVDALKTLNDVLDYFDSRFANETTGAKARDINRDSFENMRNVTNGRKIRVTPEMLANVNLRTVTDLNNATNTGTNNRIRFYSENTKNDAAVSLDSVWDEMVEQSGNELPRVMEGDQLQALIDYINAYKAGRNEEVNTVSWNDLESDFRSEGEKQLDEIADNLFDKIDDGTATKEDWEQAYNAINEIQKNDRSLADKAYETMTELSDAYREQTANADVDPDINNIETWEDAEQILDDMFDDSEEITEDLKREHNQSSGVHNGRFKQSKVFTNTGDRILSEQQIKVHELNNDMLYEENSEKESMAAAYKALEEKGADAEIKRLMNTKERLSNVDIDELMIMWQEASEEAKALDASEQNSDEAWGYAAQLYERVKEEISSAGQEVQALAKWSRNNTPQGLLSQAIEIIDNYENGYKKGRTNWTRDVRKETKNALTLDADFMKRFITEADNLYTGTWEDVKKLTDGYTIHITPEMIKALGLKSLGELNSRVYTDTENSIKFTTNAKDPKTGKPYKTIEQAYKEIYDKASDRFIDPKTISDTKMLSELYKFIANKGRMVNLETRAARHTMANLGRMINEQMPSTFAERLTTFLMDNMLGNFRTLITRNAGGNIGFNVVEEFLRRPLSAFIDAKISEKKGTARTIGDVTKEDLSAAKEGFLDGIRQEIYDFKNDIQSARSGENNLATAVANNRNNVFDISKFNKETGRFEKVYNSRLGKIYNKLVKTGLSVGDRPFYEAVYRQSMSQYRRLYREGKLDTHYTDANGNEVTERLTEAQFNELAENHAKLNALAAVYQDNSLMAQAFVGLKQDISKLSQGLVGADVLSQFSMPFVKTPANIIERSIEYSPLGFVKNLIQTVREVRSHSEDFNQERFATELSRNLIGTALFAIGVGLAQAGRMTGGYDKDKDMAQAQREAGMQEYALHTGIGDFDVSWVPVLGNNLVAAANAYDKWKNSTEGGLQALNSGLTAGVASQFDTSALQGLQRLLGGASTGYAKSSDEGILGGMKNAALAGLTQFIPSLLRQSAAVGDEYQRQLPGIKPNDYYFNSILNSIPFLRESLQPRIGRTGEELAQNAGQGAIGKFLSNFISPATWTVGTPDTVRDEAMRLFESTGNADAFEPYVSISQITTDDHTPTPEEFTQYQQAAYGAMNQVASEFIGSDFYQTLNDGERESALAEIYSAIRSVEKLNITGGDKSNLNGAAQAYNEGGSEGLLNYMIARNTLSALGRQNNPTNREEILETLNQGGYEAVQGMVDHSQELTNAGIDDYNLQLKYDHAAGVIPSLTPEQFMTTWDDIDSNSNDSITQDEMIAYLNQNPTSYDLDTALQYWNAYGSDWSYQPYFDDETGTWKKKKP